MNTETLELLRKKNEAIEKKNAKFDAMPIMKQRVALAKEILSLVSERKVSPTRGVYVEIQLPKELHNKLPSYGEIQQDPSKNIQWQQLLPRVKSCRVCMLGIAAVASVKLRNRVSLLDVSVGTTAAGWGQDDCLGALSDLFEDDELEDMEGFFECMSGALTARQSVEFFWKHILKNKGVLKYDELLKQYNTNRQRAAAAKKRRAKKG
jgi:hypothetical protein